jgi:hypothetical protein
MALDDLVTSAEAAAMLHRTTRTIHRYVDDGKLTPFRRLSDAPNGAFLFKRSDIENLKGAA